MEYRYILAAALIPVAAILAYVFHIDKQHPEPRKWLLKAFLYGLGSAVLAILVGQLNPTIEATNIYMAFGRAFLNAAIPEELCKVLMLWLILRHNPYFDEQFDGIVYAACVGLGFAAFENVLYLFSDVSHWLALGTARALLSVPGHFFFSVLMGYYISLYHFDIKRDRMTFAMILLAPVLAHGLYDGILMSFDSISENLCVLMFFAFFYFFYRLAALAKQNIALLTGK